MTVGYVGLEGGRREGGGREEGGRREGGGREEGGRREGEDWWGGGSVRPFDKLLVT